ncbi:flagella basal body P-ring formation protein FlgA [Sphingomonas sp. KR1UV-12]|uniref:Flagella basal body P-ring formation protein FlgA n=1 Tax=Sphingomonas aurea TaxID=3063994 RepID=A0ABT9EML9_9SPHN|nr:flagella basal body P-ring formation protein FlgA [Sphingomonas sp. KR1UV-12]MDP1028196.1 flagella basal body P-ring formation protein FlgA [Sphingomonas sp. KR1UV-12]
MIPLLLLAAAAAPAFQDIAALDRAVVAFTGKPQGAEGGPRGGIDARLKLQRCDMVALSWRTEAHDAVVVSCTGPDWRLFVPVNRPAGAPAAVAAPVRALPVAKAEPVIRRGDPVTIEAASGGFAITREGVAAGDAAPGARFAVRVDGAAQPVQAVAVSSGRAVLPGWD